MSLFSQWKPSPFISCQTQYKSKPTAKCLCAHRMAHHPIPFLHILQYYEAKYIYDRFIIRNECMHHYALAHSYSCGLYSLWVWFRNYSASCYGCRAKLTSNWFAFDSTPEDVFPAELNCCWNRSFAILGFLVPTRLAAISARSLLTLIPVFAFPTTNVKAFPMWMLPFWFFFVRIRV